MKSTIITSSSFQVTMADIEYLKSLQAVRELAHLVLEAAKQDALTYFHYVPARMPTAADFVAGIINVCPIKPT